jgi:hypothetical protein
MVGMEQGHFLFPEVAETPRQARVVVFQPRAARMSAGRLNGDGLAVRLRHDVERHVAHRRRMLEHLQSQAAGAGRE